MSTEACWVGETVAGFLLLLLFMAYTVVREGQYEVIIVPALLVGGFLILLAIILWLFIRGQRSQRQRSGPRGKAHILGLGMDSGKTELKKIISQVFQ